MASSPQVLCLGEALVDRLGPPGGDPATAPAAVLDDRLGGAPANEACALARLGVATAFLGRIGSDAIGGSFQRLFAQRGVDVSALQVDALRPTRIVLVQRDSAGERRFGGFAGDRGAGFADQALAAEALVDALKPLLPAARWLLVGTISLASPIAAAALRQAVDRATEAGVQLAVDVNWRPTFWDEQADPASGPDGPQRLAILSLLERAQLIKCAREEACWLFGSADPEAVSRALPRRPAVVVSDGAAPLCWWLAGRAGELPAFRVPVIDSTGAGDALTAGLLHGLLASPGLLEPGEAAPVRELMRFASACGALVCGGSGAIDPQPDLSTVRTWLQGRA